MAASMAALRSLLTWPVIVLLTVLFGLPSIPAAFLPPRGDWFLLFARGWARCLLAVAGVKVTVLRRERIPRGRSFVIVANHESFCDILILLAHLPMQVRFLAKRSIFRVPILGWSIGAAGFVRVDRGARSRGAGTVDVALKRLRDGRSLLIFPEETRTPDGELLPFKDGAALLALRTGLPILPLGLAGTFRVLPKGSYVMRAGPAVLAVGEPIELAAGATRKRRELTRLARERIGALREEARKALPVGRAAAS